MIEWERKGKGGRGESDRMKVENNRVEEEERVREKNCILKNKNIYLYV